MEFAAQDPDAATKRRVAELEKELAELKSGLNVGASEFMPSWPVADADANNNVPSPDSTLSYDQYADQIVTSLLDSSGGPLLSSPPSPSWQLVQAPTKVQAMNYRAADLGRTQWQRGPNHWKSTSGGARTGVLPAARAAARAVFQAAPMRRGTRISPRRRSCTRPD